MKFGEVVLGQSTSGKSDCVPLKKRRRLLQSRQHHPWACSLLRQDSASPGTRSCSLLSENHEQLEYPSCSSGHMSSNWHLGGVEGSAKVRGADESDRLLCDQTESEYSEAGDFSGIELLAAAASMDDDPDSADKNILLLEHISKPENFDGSSSPTLSKVSLKYESEDSSSNMKVHGGNIDWFQQNNSAAASKSLCWSLQDGTKPKVSRHHWDLNTPMDACDGDMEKDVRDDMHMEGQKDSRDRLLSNPDGTRDDSSDLKIDVYNSTSVSEGRICMESPKLKKQVQELPKSIYSNAAIETSDQAGEKDLDDRNLIQVLNCDVVMSNLNEVTRSDAALDKSPVTKLCCTSGMLMSEEKTNSISGSVAIMQDEDCFTNVSECERNMVPDGIHISSQYANLHEMTTSEPVIGIHLKDTEGSEETFIPPGTVTQEARPVLNADSNKNNGGAFVPGSKTADCQGHLELAKFDDKHEVTDHPNEGLKKTIMEDTFKSCSDGAQNDNPTTSVGRIGFQIDDWRVSDISQANNVHMVDGDEMTILQGGYDSPYEDGELRGSFFCSLEENEMENECVDYESDGRNGDGYDAADCPGSEIVAGGHGTRRSVPLKVSPDGKSRSGPVKPSLWKHSVKDDSGNNERAQKGANAASGTTVEQCMEMVVQEDDNVKRTQLIARRDTVDVKVIDTDEYASQMTVRGKLQSRIERRSSTDAADGNDVFFLQQCRQLSRGGSYSHHERDLTPDRHMSRYSSRSTTHGDRDGAHQWTCGDSRKRYASNYQGAEGRYETRPRNKIGESVDKIDGVDFHNQRQTAHYFGVGRRIHLTRVGNYTSRGQYLQRGSRDFVEDFEPPLPDDDGPPVRIPRFLSRRDQSFSPSVGRSAHLALPRRRSRSSSRTRSPRPRNKISKSTGKIDEADFHDPSRTAHYLSKGLNRPLMKRSSPGVRDDYFGVGRRIPLKRGVGNYRGRGHYSQRGGSRDFAEDFKPPLDVDAGPPRERSISPSAGRSFHMTLPARRSSKSKTRSPRPWHPQRERIFGTRRHNSRSPEFRSERMRQPFSKSSFTSNHGEEYMPPSRGRFSPQRNCRSPVRVVRRNQRFDGVGPPRRLKADDYFRPVVRPGRFSVKWSGGGGRECKAEVNYDERRRGEKGGEMMHSADDAGNQRRVRQNAGADDLETNLNNEDDNVQSYRPNKRCEEG